VSILKLRKIIFTLLASDTDFQNTALLPASAKLAVKYRQRREIPDIRQP